MSWYNYWYAYFEWELVANFAWALSDIVDPLTKFTTHMRVNPHIEGYGYLAGSFSWYFNDFWGIEISGYVEPFHAHLIDVDFWKSVNYPEWWTEQPRNALGDCFGVKSLSLPLLLDVSFDFTWPTCEWSLERFLTWVDPI